MSKYICHTKYQKNIPKINIEKIYNKGLRKNQFNKYSKIGQEFLNSIITNYINIVRIYETIDHDGYDYYGPKSNIWNIYIVYINKNNKLVYDNFNHEEWFCINDDKKYQYYSSKIYNENSKEWEKN